jgi:hypothetical protein
MGNKYISTIMDTFTKYAEIFAIPNKEAETVANCLKMDLQIWLPINNPHRRREIIHQQDCSRNI